MKKKILSVLVLVVLVSCNREEKLKGERSLVFEPKQAVRVDKKLAGSEFEVPARKAGGDWYGKANKLNRDVENFSVDVDLLEVDKVRTSIHFDGKSLLVVDGVLYKVERLGLIKAKDAETGKKIWKNRIRVSDKRMKYGQISYYDGKIFVSTGYDDVICLNAVNGQEIWRRKIKAVTISVPTFDNSRVFVMTNDNKTYALSQRTGNIVWVHSGIFNQTGIDGASAPVTSVGKVIASYSSGEVYVLNGANGREVFSFDLNLPKIIDFRLNDVDATPVVKDNIIYTVGNGGLFVAVDMRNGEFVWKREFATITDFWLAGDYIYIANNENVVASFHKDNGKVRWAMQLEQYESKKETKREIYDEVMMVNGFVLAKNYDGDIMVLNAENGRVLKKIKNKKRIGLELVGRWLR
jgi:outer membrane protein assembly factor BamB